MFIYKLSKPNFLNLAIIEGINPSLFKSINSAFSKALKRGITSSPFTVLSLLFYRVQGRQKILLNRERREKEKIKKTVWGQAVKDYLCFKDLEKSKGGYLLPQIAVPPCLKT